MEQNKTELQQSLQFLEALDKLKHTYRKCLIMSGHREESTAEHSFSLAMAVLCMAKFSNQPIDILKTMKMALFHDLAEALLGDTFHYDKKESSQSAPSETEALEKMLEPIKDTDLAAEIISLWKEFEHAQTPEAVFLRGLDRFLPMYHNYKTSGHSWVKYKVTKQMALTKNSQIEQSSEKLWAYTKTMLNESQIKGWIL